MNTKEQPRWTHGHLLALVCLFVGGAAVFHVACALKGHPVYRDQHLGTALEYARTKIDLLRPVIVGFNATGTPTPQEPPIWQAAVAVAFKLFGTWWGWGNVVSLLLFATCFFPLFRVTQDYFGTRVAWWTLVFFTAQPIIFDFSGRAGTDGFAEATAIWFLYCALRLLKHPGPGWWVATVLTGCLAVTMKLPFFLPAGLACFFLAAMFHRHSPLPWIFLGTAAAVIGLAFFGWTAYTNHCVAMAEYPYVDLRLSNPQMKFWYFGDWPFRLSPGNWAKGGWRWLNACFGSFAVAGMFGYGLCFVRANPLAKFLLAGCGITTLIFSQLVLHHTHYYLMTTPAVAMLCALAAADLEKRVTFEAGWKNALGLAGVAVVLGLAIVQGLIGIRIVLAFDSYPKEVAAIIDQYTKPTDKLLVVGGGWGDTLMHAQRDGLSIWNTTILENSTNYARLKQLGYNKLVMVSESPLLSAVEKSNPGQTHYTRQLYSDPRLLTPVAKDWPVLFQSEDVLIKEIP